MTREEALQILKYEMQTHIASEVELHIAMGMAIEALSAEAVQGGSISRQAVLSILNGFNVMDGYTDQQRAIHMVELLPSTEPKTGHWREITAEEDEEMAFLGLVECTNCGLKGAFNCNYCPNCGAYMKGEQAEQI